MRDRVHGFRLSSATQKASEAVVALRVLPSLSQEGGQRERDVLRSGWPRSRRTLKWTA